MFRIKAIYGGVALSLCMILSACGGGQKSDEIVRPVKTIKAGVSSPIETTVLSGTVCAEIEANPAFRISGVLERVYVKEGQYLEEGQLIAELDTRNAKEAAEAAKSKYEQVSAEVARVEELYKRQSVAKNEYEKAMAALELLANKLERRYPSAAASLREGLIETLTVHRLKLPGLLRQTLASTNAKESANSVCVTTLRRVSHYKDGKMTLRHAAAGFLEAERSFRRVKGYKEIPLLTHMLIRLTDSGEWDILISA